MRNRLEEQQCHYSPMFGKQRLRLGQLEPLANIGGDNDRPG
jgi:hypothetical protein